jgi:hypothetical protein
LIIPVFTESCSFFSSSFVCFRRDESSGACCGFSDMPAKSFRTLAGFDLLGGYLLA